MAAPFLLAGVLLLGRALYVFIARNFGLEASNDQALIGGGVALILGFVIFMFGILADRIGGLRRVSEEVLYRTRSHEVAAEEWRRTVSARLDQLDQSLLGDGLGLDRDDQAVGKALVGGDGATGGEGEGM